MRRKPPSRLHVAYRLFVFPALIVSTLAVFTSLPFIAELPAHVFPSGLAAAKLPNAAESEASLTAKRSISTYQWNLKDDDLPLISLPDHIGGGVDLSLTYSMDQFQFPLFQSLYYNEQAEKYILMVMSEQGGSEFIDLSLKNVSGNPQFRTTSNMLLSDKGDTKLISTCDGTVYTFAQFADGELHCSQIKDRAGLIIDLKYTDDASLARISDTSGRTIAFNYTDKYLSSITQIWGAGKAKKKKTWAIENEIAMKARSVNFAHAAPGPSKRIPTNAIKPTYTEQMAASDLTLATIFGGSGAKAAANGFEPVGLGRQYPLYRGDLIGEDGEILRGHLSFAMHLYGSPDGTGEMGLFVPLGFISHSLEPTPTDAAVTFYYPRLGNLTDVTLAVFHVSNFRLTPEGERVRIGDIGGRGGSIASYKHSHLEFYRGDTGLPSAAARAKLRIDPVTVFGSSAIAEAHRRQ